ncbi:MAG: hypothetical protein JWL64_1287, partial [Frankiales bacterium]|nr:hypothetical protein [Frankiales bacterium]
VDDLLPSLASTDSDAAVGCGGGAATPPTAS